MYLRGGSRRTISRSVSTITRMIISIYIASVRKATTI
jgi:hypothetical protein